MTNVEILRMKLRKFHAETGKAPTLVAILDEIEEEEKKREKRG